MPTPPKRPPFFAAPLLAFFLAVGAAAPAAHAQTAAQTADMAFAKVGSLTPLDSFDARPLAPGGDGARVFKLDVLYKTDALPVPGIAAFASFLEEDLEIIAVENLLSADFVAPTESSAIAARDHAAVLNGVNYAKAYEWAWADLEHIPGITAAGAYVRLLTATIKLKKPAGATTINFSGDANGPIAGKQLAIRGPANP